MQVREDGSTRAQPHRHTVVNVMHTNRTTTPSIKRSRMKTAMGLVSCVRDRDIDMNGIGIQSEIVGSILSATVYMNRMNCIDGHM